MSTQREQPVVLGEGSFGRVVTERDPGTGKTVAVKIMKTLKGEEGIPFAALRECDIYKRFRHPLMPLVHRIEILNSQVRIVMEKASGSLYDWLKQTSMPYADRIRMAVHVLWNCLSVLKFFHEHGVLHRDIKPENFLLYGRTPKLSDMGSSRWTSRGISMTAAMGTVNYRPPEMNTQRYGKSSEIYSLGCSAIHILTGSAPTRRKSTTGDYTPPCDWANLLKTVKDYTPCALYDLVRSMIYVHPGDRITVSQAMKHRLFEDSPLKTYQPQPVPWRPWPGDFTKRRGLNITASERQSIVHWMIDVNYSEGYSAVNVAHAVHMFDDFFSAVDPATVTLESLYLYSMTCLWVAAKFFEGHYMRVAFLVGLCNNKFSRADFLAAEESVVSLLGFQIIRRPLPREIAPKSEPATLKRILGNPLYTQGEIVEHKTLRTRAATKLSTTTKSTTTTNRRHTTRVQQS